MNQQSPSLALSFGLGSDRGAVLLSGVSVAGTGAIVAIAILLPAAAALWIRVMQPVTR